MSASTGRSQWHGRARRAIRGRWLRRAVVGGGALFGAGTALVLLLSGPAAASNVSAVTATPVSSVAGANTSYTVKFTTSSSGAIAPSGTITLVGPNGTNFSSQQGDYAVTAATGAATVQQVACSSVGGSTTANQVVITLSASTIAASDAVTVVTQNTSNPVTAGSYHMDVATSADTTPQASTAYPISSGQASQLAIVSGNNQYTSAGTSFAFPLVVQVEDFWGNKVTSPNYSVTFTSPALTGPSATFSGSNTQTVTSSSGVATSATPLADVFAGPGYAVHVTSTGLTGTAFTLTNTGNPAQLVITSSAVSGTASTTAGLGPITVQERDSFNNPTTLPETVNLSSNSTGTAVFSASRNGAATTSVSIPSGSSSVNFFYGDTKAGTPTVTAAAATLTSGTQQEAVTASTPAKLAISSSAANGPASSTANLGPITVQEEDTFGNPTVGAATVNLSSNTTGTPVFSATKGGGTTTSVSFASNASSASFWYGDTKAGTPTVTASATGLGNTTQQETVTAASPGKLVITSSPVSGTASPTASLGPITVQEQDTFGNVTTSALTVTLSSNTTGTAVFSTTQNGPATTTVSISSGSSTTSFYYGDTKAGTPTITVASTGLTSGTQQETVTAGSQNQLAIISGNNQVTPTGTAFGQQLVVQVEDGSGNPVSTSGIQITLTAPSSGASGHFGNGTTTEQDTTGSNGRITSSVFTANSTAGPPYSITVTSSGLTSSSFTMANSGPPSKFVFTTVPVSGPASSTANLGAITVQEQDQYNNATITAETVNLASSDTSTGVFATTSGGSPVTSVSITSGSSSATFYYGDTQAGTPTLTASGTLTSATQQETITAAAPSKLVFTTGAFSAPASSTANSSAITVQAQDAFGNPATTGETVNLSSTDPSTGVFSTASGGSPVTSVSITSGSSSATFYYGDTKAGTPTITAAASGITNATQQETITAAAPAQLVFTTGPVSGQAASTATLGPITVQEQDAFGNPTTTAETVNLSSSDVSTGVFSATSGGTPVTSVNIASGTSSVNFFYGDTKAGTPTITAAATGLTSGTQQETVSAASVAKLVFTSPAVTGPASSSANLGPITVQEQDSFGNPTTTAETVNLSSSDSSTGVFSATNGGSAITSVAITSGNSFASFYYGDTKTGSPTLTAAATGLTSGTQQETISTAPSSVTIVYGNNQSASEGTPFGSPLEVQVLDQFGNPVAGSQVTFLAPSNGGPSGSFDQSGCSVVSAANTCVVTTNANGIATSSTLTANGAVGSYQVGAYSAVNGVQTYFSLTNSMSVVHVLVRGSNGDLVEYVDDHLNGHVWNAYDHTAGTGALPMALGAVPSIVDDPVSRLEHVYVRASNGDLQEYVDDHLNGRIWNVYDLTQSALGPGLGGDPYALLDPTQDVIHVYAQTTSGDLVEYVSDGRNSRPWNAYDQSTPTGVKIAGVPDAIIFGSAYHVYFHGGNGDLFELVNDNLNGRVWNAYDQSASAGYGAISGSPAVYVVGSYVHVYVPGHNGDLVEFLNDNLNGRVWNAYDQTAGAGGGTPIMGIPSPLSLGGNLHIYTQAANGDLVEYVDDHLNGHVWNAYDQSAFAGGGQPLGSRPLPIVLNGIVHVYTQDVQSDLLEYVDDGLNGHVWNAYDQSAGAGGGGQIGGAPSVFTS